MPTIQIDPELCKKCGTCVQICPEDLFVQDEKGTVPKPVIDLSHCLDCGHCVAICPNEAISHSAYPLDSIHPIHPEMLPNTEQLMELLRSRRAVREFRHKPVERAAIEQVIDGARFAPSAHNVQSTEFIVIQDKEILNQIVKITIDQMNLWRKLLKNPVVRLYNRLFSGMNLDELVEGFTQLVHQYEQGKDCILNDAPALLLFHADRHAAFAGTNAQLALQNASLVCETVGLGAFYTGFVIFACDFSKQIAQLLELPPNHKIYGGLAIGYPRFHYHKWIDRQPAQIKWL